jgi:hypothetical protein
MMTDQPGSDTPRRVIAEPRLVILALVGVLVMMLSIVAIFETDGPWIVLLTLLAIAAIAVVIVLDLWRVLAASGDDAQPQDADDVNRGL